MKDYIEKTLHIGADISEYIDTRNLPLYLKEGYVLQTMDVAGLRCLLMQPKEQTNLAALRKQREQLKKLSGMECVLCFDAANGYAKQKLLSEGIPFIVKGTQVYMPFLGVAIAKSKERETQPTERISFLTQRLVIIAIYEGWKSISLAEVAEKMGVSRMSISRSFNELVGLAAALIATKGKTRCFLFPGAQELWEIIKPVLRSPVYKQYLLDETITDLHTLGGMSAVCTYTMLADNSFSTYALTKEEAKQLGISERPTVPKGEIPAAVVQVLQYSIPFADGAAIDPLSAILSLTDEEKADPRVEMAIEQIMEEYVHD